MKRALITAALAGVITVHGLTAAHASEYPAAPAQGGVDTGSISPGGSVEFDGTGLTPDEQGTVITRCAGTDGATTTASAPLRANTAGEFSYVATIDTAGECTLSAEGNATTTPITAQVSVREPGSVAGAVDGSSAATAADGAESLAATGVGAPLMV